MSQNATAMKRHMKRAVEILLHQGPKAFVNKLKLHLQERKPATPAPSGEKTVAYADLHFDPESFAGTLAVQLHLFYDDLADEFAESLVNIPVSYDLYISVQESMTDQRIEALQKQFQAGNVSKVVIRRGENRGRDIAPLYVLFGQELQKYDYVLHLQSKKSLYTGTDQQDWRQYSVDTLIGSKEAAGRLLALLADNPDVGLIYPKRFEGMAPEAYGWLSNAREGRDFLESLGVPFQGGILMYPAGSFFIMRTAAIRQIWERKLKYTDFDAENGQTDGTLAHVLERAVSVVSRFNGYHDVILDEDDQKAHFDSDRSTFLPVFRRNQQFLQMELESYDVVSFDIFDTLLTRTIHDPEDLFAMIPSAAGLKMAGQSFRQNRMEAEIQAIHEKRDYCNLNEIYDNLQKMLHLDADTRDKLQQAELDLERAVLVPRRNMQRLYQQLRSEGKTIILTSDMYLPKTFLEDVLRENGYMGYSRVYISCEEGRRKDDGTLWELVFSEYPGKTIAHVGDNQQSDWQVLSDRQEKTIWIMGPGAEKQISGISIDPGNANSLVRGLVRNGGFFNSPFALSDNGRPHFTDPYTMGYTVFGPLLYAFICWIQENTKEDTALLFLAREGWMFRQIYQIAFGDKARKNVYLLASRRAVSVAAIRSEADIDEILRRKYDGSLHNLLESRLGMPEELQQKIPEKLVHIADPADHEPDDYEKVCKTIKPLVQDILDYAAKEREGYLAYLHKTLDGEDPSRAVLIDIGYAGTIQYYMAKLLQHPVNGMYLAVFKENEKLKDTGSQVQTMYLKGRDDFAAAIENTQLFLESVLQAPYGQLLHIGEDGPVYREEKKPSEEIQQLQQGILDYARQRATIEHMTDVKSGAEERTYMERCCQEFLLGHDYMTSGLARIFSVEDKYSQDTTLHLDPETHRWGI